MAELYMLAPLFAGSTSMDQIHKVIKIMGTPAQSEWPEGYIQAQKIGFNWPKHNAVPLSSLVTSASPEALAFIQVYSYFLFLFIFFYLQSTLIYDPNKRPTANQLLSHPYFEKFMKLEIPDNRLKSRES